MNVIGIISEYNPFHRGHMYHISASRTAAGGECAVVCVISGDFVQRGEPAIFNKHARSEMALRCGADLVFELPVPWSVASAEGFARGAVGLLGELGVVTHLSFGSESGQIEPLEMIAMTLSDPLFDRKIVEYLETGLPYAAARQRALEDEMGDTAKLISTPNNILAVEYLRAMNSQGLRFAPLAIKRVGAGHDGRAAGEIRSASELRAMLDTGKKISGFIPPQAERVIDAEMKNGRGPVSAERMEQAILARLRMMTAPEFESVPDASEGIDKLLYRAAMTEPTLDGVAAAVKSKRYAMSRIRRMIMCAALGVKKGMSDTLPPYARLLGASDTGRQLLREIQLGCYVPVVTKPAAANALDSQAREIFALTAKARDLYVLAYQAGQERRGGSDYRMSPIIL